MADEWCGAGRLRLVTAFGTRSWPTPSGTGFPDEPRKKFFRDVEAAAAAPTNGRQHPT